MENEKKVVTTEGKEVARAISPELISQAVNKGTDLAGLERLWDLQIKYEANEAKKAYTVAMAAFKANPPQINKDKRVKYETSKGTTEYSHASLANVAEKINASLSEHGLSAAWTTKQDGAVSVTCKITHALGHSEETMLTAGADTTGSKNSIQAIGSTITYLQRYTLLSLTGLATADQDDDGQGSEEVAYLTEEQLGQIKDYTDNYKGFEARLLKHLKVESLNKIPASAFNKALIAMETAKKQAE